MHCLGLIPKNLLLGLLCTVAVITSSARDAISGDAENSSRSASMKADDLVGFACDAAYSSDYNLFKEYIMRNGFKHPDWQTYLWMRCLYSKTVLQAALLRRNVTFIRSFLRGIYLDHGREEVEKIVNHPDYLYGLNLLEEAIVRNRCSDETLAEAGDDDDIYFHTKDFEYFRKIGGKTRPDFIRFCREFRKEHKLN